VTINFRGKGLYTFRTKSKNDKIQELEEDNQFLRYGLFDEDRLADHKKSYTFVCYGTYLKEIGSGEKVPEGCQTVKVKKFDLKTRTFKAIEYIKYKIEFEIFQNKEKITTMNFRVNDEKEEIVTIPIEKEFAIGGNNEFSLWIVIEDDQPPIRLKGKLIENEKDHSFNFVPVSFNLVSGEDEETANRKLEELPFNIELEY